MLAHFLIASLTALFAAFAPQTPEVTSRPRAQPLFVRVLDAQTQLPIANARVEIFAGIIRETTSAKGLAAERAAASAVTDDHGAAVLDSGMRPSDYSRTTVGATCAGYGTRWTATPDGFLSRVDRPLCIYLPHLASLRVARCAHSASDDTEIAVVQNRREVRRAAPTEPILVDGLLPDVPVLVSIVSRESGAILLHRSIMLRPGETCNAHLCADNSATISGKITDSTGLPVADTMIFLGERSQAPSQSDGVGRSTDLMGLSVVSHAPWKAVTDAQGYFCFSGVMPGSYWIGTPTGARHAANGRVHAIGSRGEPIDVSRDWNACALTAACNRYISVQTSGLRADEVDVTAAAAPLDASLLLTAAFGDLRHGSAELGPCPAGPLIIEGQSATRTSRIARQAAQARPTMYADGRESAMLVFHPQSTITGSARARDGGEAPGSFLVWGIGDVFHSGEAPLDDGGGFVSSVAPNRTYAVTARTTSGDIATTRIIVSGDTCLEPMALQSGCDLYVRSARRYGCSVEVLAGDAVVGEAPLHGGTQSTLVVPRGTLAIRIVHDGGTQVMRAVDCSGSASFVYLEEE